MTPAQKQKLQARANKPVFKTNVPFSSPRWPASSPELQKKILTNLIELIAPIGEYRARSKGRHSRKRRREHAELNTSARDADERDRPKDDPPLVLEYLTVGYNTTIRVMNAQTEPPSASHRQLIAVFVLHDPQSIQFAHLPILAAQTRPRLKLIPLAHGADAKIAAALGLPRVGLLGVQKDAPGAAPLLSVTEEFEDIVVDIFSEGKDGNWRDVQVDTLDKLD